MTYINSINTALVWFPLVASLITLPYMIVQYRKYGGIVWLRTAIVYSFVLYCMCAYFLTMLPLPSREEVAAMNKPYTQLVPFLAHAEIFTKNGFTLSDPSTWLDALTSPECFQVIANIAMLVPLGMYLRYYFKCGWKRTLLISFLASLLFEITQLTGLFFYYPRPYRLFEIDDLINNTLGGMIGYWIAPLFIRLLPSRERLDEMAREKGRSVSLTRRTLAAALDWPIVLVTATALSIVGVSSFMLSLAITVLVYFVLIPWRNGGQTLGKKMVRLRVVGESGGAATLLQLLIRYGVIYLMGCAAPYLFFVLWSYSANTVGSPAIAGAAAILLVVVCVAGAAVMMVLSALKRGRHLPHNQWSRTMVAAVPRECDNKNDISA